LFDNVGGSIRVCDSLVFGGFLVIVMFP
jgi:hypothetical protein